MNCGQQRPQSTKLACASPALGEPFLSVGDGIIFPVLLPAKLTCDQGTPRSCTEPASDWKDEKRDGILSLVYGHSVLSHKLFGFDRGVRKSKGRATTWVHIPRKLSSSSLKFPLRYAYNTHNANLCSYFAHFDILDFCFCDTLKYF